MRIPPGRGRGGGEREGDRREHVRRGDEGKGMGSTQNRVAAGGRGDFTTDPRKLNEIFISEIRIRVHTLLRKVSLIGYVATGALSIARSQSFKVM